MNIFVLIAFAIIIALIVIGFESKSRNKRRMTIKEEESFEIRS